MECPEAIDVMDEALAGRLAADLVPGFAEHMAECVPCATYFAQLHVTRAALHALQHETAACPQREKLLEAFRRSGGKPGP